MPELIQRRLGPGETPVRFVITETTAEEYLCELGVMDSAQPLPMRQDEIFRFRKRRRGPQETFTAAFLIPTGIDAECGGHAGDATPALRLIASIADRVVTHPNVVNASDINEMPDNCLYVEGSVLSRFFMGTVGLQKVRANRLGIIIERHFEKIYTDATLNAVSAARATLGAEFGKVIVTSNKIRMTTEYTSSGRASGRIEKFEVFYQLLNDMKEEVDAIAIASRIDISKELYQAYWKGGVVNPWGGVEAILTHAVSSLMNLPSAHSPMMESQEFAAIPVGVSDPRKAAEAISMTFLHCILKGLHRSPRVVPLEKDSDAFACSLTVSDVDCLVIPDGAVGLPTLAAIEQGIPIIAVRGNKNMMRNDLAQYAGDSKRLIYAENYLEAAGWVAAMRAGIARDALLRPLPNTPYEAR